MSAYLELIDSEVYNKTSQPLYLDFESGPHKHIEIAPNKEEPQKHITGRLTSVRQAQIQLRPWEPVQTKDAVPGSELQFHNGLTEENIVVYLNGDIIPFKQREPTSKAD